MAQHWGPVMLLHLGRVPTVVVSSAEPAKDVSLPLYGDYWRAHFEYKYLKITYLYAILKAHFEWVPLSESEKSCEDMCAAGTDATYNNDIANKAPTCNEESTE
ncbi:hypothetical protein WN943_013472 [Citrus x changshan-huyou]